MCVCVCVREVCMCYVWGGDRAGGGVEERHLMQAACRHGATQRAHMQPMTACHVAFAPDVCQVVMSVKLPCLSSCHKLIGGRCMSSYDGASKMSDVASERSGGA